MIFKYFFLKEIKKHPFFFILLSFTILLGTLSLVAIGVISQSVREKLNKNAHELLTSDLAVSARRELFSSEIQKLDSLLKDFPHHRYKLIDIYTMVSRPSLGISRLVEVRATESPFPFYGKIHLEKGEFSSGQLYVSKNLVDLWQVKVGDELKVGDLTLKISGIVAKDSSQGLRGFSLAPRIYLPLEKLYLTGLLKPGATGSFSHHFKFKKFSEEKAKKIKSLIYEKIQDSAVKVTLAEESSEQTGRVMNLLTNFMSLSALLGLILSLVGVFYLYQSHLLSRLKDYALLSLHGMSRIQLIWGVVFQFSLVFMMVFLVEIFLLLPLYHLFSPLLSNYLGSDLSEKIHFKPALTILPFLYVVSLSVIFPFLRALQRISWGRVLKSREVVLDKFKVSDFLLFIFTLWPLCLYVSQSMKLGSFFFISLLVTLLVSMLVVKVVKRLVEKSFEKRGLSLPFLEAGLAMRGFARSGQRTSLTFLALSLGGALMTLILQLDSQISREITLEEDKPSLFLFDIQEDQMDPLRDLALKNNTPLSYVSPMIRGRLEKVNGKKFSQSKNDFDLRSREREEENRQRNNGINLSYRSFLTKSEMIIKGPSFPPSYSSDRLPYISLEKRWAQRMGIDLGDQLTFDIQGVEFEGVVLNFREVKWTTFNPNFFIIVEPGPLELAPKTYLAILPSGPKEKKLSLQHLTVEKFPNISFIDVEELVGKLFELYKKAGGAILVITIFTLIIGVVVLYGLSHDQVYRRRYDLALMKGIGLSSFQVRNSLYLEFGTLFILAYGLGSFLGWLVSAVIGKEIFKISPEVDWERMLYPFLLLIILCLGTIFLSSWRSVRAKPRVLLSEM